MASCKSIHGSPIGAFKHDLRERDLYKNEDVDKSRSHLNYTLSAHGNTSKECMDYYNFLLSKAYHRAGGTVNSAEWSIQEADGLEPERKEEFFISTMEFLNNYLLNGDDSRCILAQVHRDEAGKDHLHYVFTFPEVPNEKYVKPQDKFFEGMRKAVEKYDLRPSKKDLQDCLSALERYEKRSDKARERETIQEIGRIFGLNRDDARWVFTRVRRLDSERFEKRLQSKDDFLTRDLFRKFHPAFQKWMDEHGFHCTVYKGGGRVNLTVDQLKKLSKATGKTFKHGISLDYLSDLIKENDRLQMRVAELERQSHTRGWGDPSGWGGSRDKEITR